MTFSESWYDESEHSQPKQARDEMDGVAGSSTEFHFNRVLSIRAFMSSKYRLKKVSVLSHFAAEFDFNVPLKGTAAIWAE